MESYQDNPFFRLKSLNPETELWWDASPLMWGHFRESFAASLSGPDASWFLTETGDRFAPAPADRWFFTGCTTNPRLTWAVLTTHREEWARIISEQRRGYRGQSAYGLFRRVYAEAVRRGAEAFLPQFEATDGRYGHVSGQVDPGLMRDSAGMIEMAEELAELGPNVMVKVPGSVQGIPVFRHLAARGIATNATLVYTVPQIMAVAAAIDEGRRLHLERDTAPRKGWRAVCTHMSGRLEDSVVLKGYIEANRLDITTRELRFASDALVKKAAQLIAERGYPIKMLACSHREHYVPDELPSYPHLEMFAGGPVVLTVPATVFGNFMLWYRDREIVSGWDQGVSDETLSRLNRIPWFAAALDERGIAVDEFERMPMFLETEDEFGTATRAMIDFVGGFL